MNLLTKYIPDYSGHLEKIEYDEQAHVLRVVFYDRPEEFNPVVELVFSGVTDYSCELLDEEAPNCIELAIGFDLMQLGYCLHTDVREIVFNAEKVDKIELNT
jgi:hypothetical protein